MVVFYGFLVATMVGVIVIHLLLIPVVRWVCDRNCFPYDIYVCLVCPLVVLCNDSLLYVMLSTSKYKYASYDTNAERIRGYVLRDIED